MKPRERSTLASPGGAQAVAGLCLVQFVAVLGVTVIVTLPGLGAPSSATALVVTRLRDVLRWAAHACRAPRRSLRAPAVVLIGLVGFGAASFMAAAAESVPALVAACCLQGAAAALRVPRRCGCCSPRPPMRPAHM
jgi:MFS family permease